MHRHKRVTMKNVRERGGGKQISFSNRTYRSDPTPGSRKVDCRRQARKSRYHSGPDIRRQSSARSSSACRHGDSASSRNICTFCHCRRARDSRATWARSDGPKRWPRRIGLYGDSLAAWLLSWSQGHWFRCLSWTSLPPRDRCQRRRFLWEWPERPSKEEVSDKLTNWERATGDQGEREVIGRERE